ncbi:related to Nuclear pore complex protein Nup214 [Sporisorium reilianum SRZ2]|uniref:Related to Nuclear pore complex protein Nup214 n=1 Tax=Sporisorium reilianum (strain SRZ2) TaxID=999809 RepID=E6ZRP1_SPORE|nr:related to Nuclear pore complex protein Nup214 [Sporisorium reilianum SRZ2]
MDFPAQHPDSPAKPLAGPARARVLARQNRTSSLKPYARPSSGLTASGSSASLHTDTDSPARQPSTPSAKSLVPPSSQQPTRSAFSPLRVAASPIALLGSVRKMVSKPLSWLTSAATSVEPELGIPTSSSTNSLSSIARKRAAARASLGAAAAAAADESSYERDAPTRAARAVGERLAAGLRSRSNLNDDEENQLHPPPSTLSSSMSMSRLAPGPAPARTPRNQSPFNQNSPLAGSSALPTSPFKDNKATTWSSRSSKRTLDVGSRSVDPTDSLEILSDASRASPSRTTQPHNFRSQHTLRSPRSQVLGYRGSSLRPDDAMSESGSTSLSHSHSFSAFGYGNEVRYTDSAFGLPPSSSPFQLSSRNAVTRRARAPFTSGLFTDAGTPGRSSRAGSVSLRGASPAPSAGYSPARQREGTPQRRNWNGINLAAPSAPSVGDEMMREYLASRALPGINPSVRRNLGLPVDDPMITSSSVAGGSVMDETESLTPSRLGKRDIDMSIDGDSERFGTPSKRRMVWHPELGFISHEELKAREPKLPSPKNEAERLLNVLETMRKPTATSRGVGLARGPSTQIHVPAPISDLPATRSTKPQEGKPAIGVAPYTRYLRKAKTVQSADEQSGMRAKLKRVQRADKTSKDESAMDESDASEKEQDAEEQHEEEEDEEEEEEEEEPAPPQPEPVRRSRRLQHQAPSATEQVTQTPVKQHADKPARTTQLKSALKATPLRAASKQPEATPAKPAAELAKPASHRIPLSAATKTPSSALKKDNFAVKASTSDPSAPRERSSLRQGAAKTSRTHQSSGKFSAWDEDEEEEDLPDASELAKIKLPTNMFPSGFSFGGAAPAPAAESKPAAASDSSSKAAGPAASSAGGSLLGRLGGFDSSAPAAQTDKKEAPKTTAAPAAPSFSFSAPSKDAPNTMPKFSFGASAAPATASKDGDSTAKKPAAPTSDFFSKPAEPASSTSLSEGKKDGPVPNFFGSTMKKLETKSTDAPAAPAATGGFSFGAPAAASTAASDAAASKPAPFSFGAAKPAAAESSSTSSSASNPFGSFGAKPAESAEKKQDAAAAPASKPSFFNSSTASSGTGGFSFGAPSTSSAASGSKRDADDDDEPAAKKSMPSFSFGAPAASKPAAPAASGFSFGAPSAPAAAEKKDDATPAKSSGVPNFFGSKGEDAPKPAAPSSGGFTFGKPASDSSAGSTGFGTSKPAETPASGGFAFGVSKPASADASKPAATGGFSFGAASGANNSAGSSPAPEAKPAASTAPTFSFGAPAKSAASDAAAAASSPTTSAPVSGTTTPTGAFVFGAPAASSASSATADSKPAGSGFSFGAPSTSSGAATGFGATSNAGGGFGGFGAKPAASAGGGEMMDDSPQKTAPAAGGSSTPSFTFGSATPTATPAAAAAKPAGGMSFAFGTPSASTPAAGAGAGTASPSTFTFGSAAAPAAGANSNSGAAAGAGGFRFGSPAPAAAPATGFTFGATPAGSTTPGVGSTPASPFLAPSGAPPTPGGSPFQFGAAATQPPSAATPFQFGSQPAPGGFTFGSAGAAQPSTPTSGGFGASANGGGATAAFGAAGGFGTPSTPAQLGAAGGFTFGTPAGAMPQLPHMQAQPGLFSMGAAPSSGPNSPAPGGRQIKPLRQRRR